MNRFIAEYIERLKRIEREEDVKDLYHWFWERSDQIRITVEEINRTLSLPAKCQLKPDLPCLAIGSFNGLLLLNLNPGWREDLNRLEDAYCRTSPYTYIDLMENFFARHPEVVGEKGKWWNSALSWIRLLEEWETRFESAEGTDRWAKAQQSRLVGGWELFPFHSSKDGLAGLMAHIPWLRACAIESVKAAIRMSPEILFVASKRGWQFVRFDVLGNERWLDSKVGTSRFETSISYARVGDRTEVIALARQFTAHRNFKNEEVLSKVQEFRGRIPKSLQE